MRAFKNDILQDSRGDIWFANEFQGLLRIDAKTNQPVSHYWPHANITALAEDKNGHVWAANPQCFPKPDGSAQCEIFLYEYCPDGDCPHGDSPSKESLGGDLFEKNSFYQYRVENKVKGKKDVVNRIFSMYIDDANTLWLGAVSGLIRFLPKAGTTEHFFCQHTPFCSVSSFETQKIYINTVQ